MVDSNSQAAAKGGPFSIRTIAEVGIVVALAAVLNFLPVFKMPQGGSVSLDMVPIIFLAFYRGPKIGMVAGAVFGVVDYFFEPFFVHPVQLILDYPLAFALLGLAGFAGSSSFFRVAAGTIIGGAARFLAHFISGAIFFASYAPKGQSPWLYSAVYNGSYLLPSIAISIPMVWALLKAFDKAEAGGALKR